LNINERKTSALGVARKRVLGVKVLLRARGLPSKGEARALHHQPAPALTLTMPCLLLLTAQQVAKRLNTIENPKLTKLKNK
jgi:hypothetical protein